MFLVAESATPAPAASGDVDSTYGENGVATINFNDTSATNRVLFADSNGNAFDVWKAPWQVSGSGTFLGQWAGDPHLQNQRDAAMDGSGRIVVVGWDSFNNDMRIVRWSNAELDPTFGSSASNSPGVELPRSPDGALIAAAADGSVMIGSGGSLIKLTSSGELDPSWNPNGTTPGILPFASAVSFAFTPTGDLMVACSEPSQPGPCLTRLLPDGAIDQSFGIGGWAPALSAAGTDDLDLGLIVVADDDSVYDAGSDLTSGRAVIARYDPNGQPVASFGADGLAEDPLADTVTPYSYGSLITAPDGGLYGALTGGDRQLRIAKYTATGQRDAMVGTDGVIDLPSASVAPDTWDGLAIAPKGNLLAAAGTLSTAWVYRFATAAAPGAPAGVDAAPGDSTVTLTWSSPSYIGSEPVTSYRVYRSTTSGQRGSLIAAPATTTLVDTHATNGTPYYYQVTAVNAAGEGVAAPQVTATPQARPGAPTVLASAGNGFVGLSWTTGASTSPVTAYQVYRSTMPGVRGDLLGVTGATTYSDTAVTNGVTYYYEVTGTNASGEGPPSAQLKATPYAPPTVTITGDPAELSREAHPTFTFTGSDPNGLPTTMFCGVDEPPSQQCSSGVFTTSPGDGAHIFTVKIWDTAGPGLTASYAWTIDATAPTLTLSGPSQPFVLGRTKVTWLGRDSGSGVASYDLRYRRAAVGRTLGSWLYPASWQGTVSTSVPWHDNAGYTDCFSVRARDRANNASAWTPARCTSVPLDDRALGASPGWIRANAVADYRGTITTSARTGARLARTSVVADRLALVATRCADCGTVRVYFAGDYLATVRLYAPNTHRRSVILLPRIARKTGSVTIRVVSAGRKVAIDGLGASRV